MSGQLSVNVRAGAVSFIVTEDDGRVLVLELTWKMIKKWVRKEGTDVAPVVRTAVRATDAAEADD